MEIIWRVTKMETGLQSAFIDLYCLIDDVKTFHNSFIITLTREQYIEIGKPIVGDRIAVTLEGLGR